MSFRASRRRVEKSVFEQISPLRPLGTPVGMTWPAIKSNTNFLVLPHDIGKALLRL